MVLDVVLAFELTETCTFVLYKKVKSIDQWSILIFVVKGKDILLDRWTDIHYYDSRVVTGECSVQSFVFWC